MTLPGSGGFVDEVAECGLGHPGKAGGELDRYGAMHDVGVNDERNPWHRTHGRGVNLDSTGLLRVNTIRSIRVSLMRIQHLLSGTEVLRVPNPLAAATSSSDRNVLILMYVGVVVLAVAVTAVLRRFVRGSKRPIALGMMILGVLLIVPLMATGPWRLVNIELPEAIGVPMFILGFVLFLLGGLVFRFLGNIGEA